MKNTKNKKKKVEKVKVPLTLYFCVNCKNVQVKEVINPNLLWKNYTYFSAQTKAIINHFNSFSKKNNQKI